MRDEEQIAQVELKIAELKARLPRHTVPPAMVIELEDLEEELQALKAGSTGGPD